MIRDGSEQPDVSWELHLPSWKPSWAALSDSDGLSHVFDLVMVFCQVLSLSPEGCEYIWVFTWLLGLEMFLVLLE